MAAKPLSREHSLSNKEAMSAIYTYGIIKHSLTGRREADEGPMDDSESSPIETYERVQLEIKNSGSDWNNPKDSYGSVPYDGTDTSMLLPPDDPNYDTAGSHNSAPVTTTTNTSGGTTPAGRTVSAAAIIIPVLLILALVTCLGWLFHASGYNLSYRIRRRNSKDIDPATVASDLEGGQPPRTLSPSAVPIAVPREAERGWMLMPNTGFGNWVRGYRRRSDPRGAGNEDWQLDVNDVGEAPPDYAEAEREKQVVDTENVRRMNTNDTTMTGETGIGSVRSEGSLPAYNVVGSAQSPPQQGREDEVHGRAAEESGDVGNARDGGEKNETR